MVTKNRATGTEVVGFDLDYTLIQPKSGNKFPKNENDIKLWNDAVIPKLKQLNQEGKMIVIFSNQLNLLKEKDIYSRKMAK